jgi:hypothetical protein
VQRPVLAFGDERDRLGCGGTYEPRRDSTRTRTASTRVSATSGAIAGSFAKRSTGTMSKAPSWPA